jgi:zinc D-Ala-D-Ala carboxypeptidase
MKLTEHFSLHEFIKSDTAERWGIDNTPDENIIENLKILAQGLEDVRLLLDNPITISSGYRCPNLNDLLRSKRTSQHLQGLAADFRCDKFGNPNDIINCVSESDIPFDQIILEFWNPDVLHSGWVHISFCKNPKDARKQALIIDKDGARLYKNQ